MLAIGLSKFLHWSICSKTSSSWRDLNCPFRKDPRTHLVFLPTLLRWKSPQRLDGEKACQPDLVEMLFSDED
jgi:Eukaryotic protein of unknown function (DUF953)